MCIQLNLELIYKRPKKEGGSTNFYGFWSEELHCEKKPPKKNL
jgi:hypothetical protein